MPAEHHLLTPDADIAFWDEGGGDAVLLVHASFGADWFAPLAGLLPGLRVVRTHRAGYGRSRDLSGRLSVTDHTRHLAEVLGARGIGQAHVVGHSTGGTLALQLAAAHPGIVRSMVLLEPALPYAADEPRSDAMRRAVAAAEEGDLARAYGHFPGSVCSPGYLDVMTHVLGREGFRKSVLSGRYFFEHERAAFAAWDADAAGLEALRQPVLLVAGGEGERLDSPYRARNRALAARLARAEQVTLPGVSHAMPLEDPGLVAWTVLDFVRRHPVDAV
ncbi:alpha/beta fold hydrolase [Actinacidiphila glaucinigra]|uniref:Pimeloyl-ACP methyl ester carboxylesterase n=1 Tax=Actinacidiphila glaucinigra TaxID=235986 RepID=A0A239GHP1_9ACTN|nr:alpha/beta hydrolase [Actinacidiphila glaucinigra]SNS67574.1 Pimeloyl-ACP methyl ester carboxylesterase [Actinacidiphila glaucinigra]